MNPFGDRWYSSTDWRRLHWTVLRKLYFHATVINVTVFVRIIANYLLVQSTLRSARVTHTVSRLPLGWSVAEPNRLFECCNIWNCLSPSRCVSHCYYYLPASSRCIRCMQKLPISTRLIGSGQSHITQTPTSSFFVCRTHKPDIKYPAKWTEEPGQVTLEVPVERVWEHLRKKPHSLCLPCEMEPVALW